MKAKPETKTYKHLNSALNGVEYSSDEFAETIENVVYNLTLLLGERAGGDLARRITEIIIARKAYSQVSDISKKLVNEILNFMEANEYKKLALHILATPGAAVGEVLGGRAARLFADSTIRNKLAKQIKSAFEALHDDIQHKADKEARKNEVQKFIRFKLNPEQVYDELAQQQEIERQKRLEIEKAAKQEQQTRREEDQFLKDNQHRWGHAVRQAWVMSKRAARMTKSSVSGSISYSREHVTQEKVIFVSSAVAAFTTLHELKKLINQVAGSNITDQKLQYGLTGVERVNPKHPVMGYLRIVPNLLIETSGMVFRAIVHNTLGAPNAAYNAAKQMARDSVNGKYLDEDLYERQQQLKDPVVRQRIQALIEQRRNTSQAELDDIETMVETLNELENIPKPVAADILSSSISPTKRLTQDQFKAILLKDVNGDEKPTQVDQDKFLEKKAQKKFTTQQQISHFMWSQNTEGSEPFIKKSVEMDTSHIEGRNFTP